MALVRGLARVSERYHWRVHAFCLMDTHVHAVIETLEPTLSAGMKRLLGGYAFEFNRRHARYGHLFGGPFSASLVQTDAYVIEVCAYVVLNPVRAGLVRSAEDWRWSSYRASVGLVKSPSFSGDEAGTGDVGRESQAGTGAVSRAGSRDRRTPKTEVRLKPDPFYRV